MSEFCYFLLANGLLASLLALVVCWTSRWIRRPALLHLLWVMVLLRLVVPPILTLDISGAKRWAANWIWQSSGEPTAVMGRMMTDRSDLIAAVGRAVQKQTVIPIRNVLPRSDTVAVDEALSSRLSIVAAVREVVKQTSLWFHAVRGAATVVLFSIWCLGTTVCVVIQVRSGLLFRRDIMGNAYQSRLWQARIVQVAKRMQLRRCPDLLLVRATVSPMLWGFGRRAKVLFPEKLLLSLDQRAQNTLLAHELAHYRRGDQWVRLLELFATAMFWWHPVLWWARREIEQAEERCCDAWAVRCANGRPRTYAEALLAAVDFVSQRYLPPVASGVSHTSFLRQRIHAIMEERIVGRRSLIPSSYPGVAALAAFVLIPCPALWSVRPVAMLAASRTSAASVLSISTSGWESIGPAGVAAESSELHEVSLVLDENQRATFHNRGQRLQLDLGVAHVASSSFSRDGRYLAVGTLDGQLEVRSCQTGQPIKVVDVSFSSVRAVCVAPNDPMVVAGSSDGVCRLVSFQSSGVDEVTRRRPGAAVRSARFSRSGRYVAVVWDHPGYQQIELWDLASNRVRSSGPADFGIVAAMDLGSLTQSSWHVVDAQGRLYQWDGDAAYTMTSQTLSESSLRCLRVARTPLDSVTRLSDGHLH